MIEKIIGLEKAYKRRVKESRMEPKLNFTSRVYAERKAKGLCAYCGKRKTTPPFVSCKQCRRHRQNIENKKKENKIRDLLGGL